MSIIKIKNFGPIGENRDKNGYLIDNGYFTVEISSVSVFIGYQASGKSTVAKLYSIFAWLEKTLQRDFLPIEINTTIFKSLCGQQEIGEFFHHNTAIKYEGEFFFFECDIEKNVFTTERKETESHIVPKIQYVSAARNLLTILYRIADTRIPDNKGNIIELSPNIPFMVMDLNKEYAKALENFGNEGFDLPINGTSVYHDNHKTFIKTNKKIISMSAAASGIQSIVPLLLVSSFLSKEVQKSLFDKLNNISSIDKNRIEKKLSDDNELVEKFNLYCMGGREILGKDNDVEQLENRLNKYIPSYFINIVEEPEQNLFPETQAEIIYKLLEYKNTNPHNKLVISTHSPYILLALNNAVLADKVFKKNGRKAEALPNNKMVAEIAAYMFENGRIVSIIDEETGLINAEKIDDCSSQINEIFDNLLTLSDDED